MLNLPIEMIILMQTFTPVFNEWYTPGQDPLPLRWVLVRDPLGKLLPAAFFATDLKATPEQILE